MMAYKIIGTKQSIARRVLSAGYRGKDEPLPLEVGSIISLDTSTRPFYRVEKIKRWRKLPVRLVVCQERTDNRRTVSINQLDLIYPF